jgi:hypothetical protein
VSRTWWSIRVELVSGRGRNFWPRPGRDFAAARRHTFADLAGAIDDAFARWDRAHLHLFDLGDVGDSGDFDPEVIEGGGLLVGRGWEERPAGARLDTQARLGELRAGQRFAYVFDLGDDWAHICTVGTQRIDPLDELGIVPEAPTTYFGWGDLPDQYGRRFADDDGEGPIPPDPGLQDLPPLQPGWGPPPQ